MSKRREGSYPGISHKAGYIFSEPKTVCKECEFSVWTKVAWSVMTDYGYGANRSSVTTLYDYVCSAPKWSVISGKEIKAQDQKELAPWRSNSEEIKVLCSSLNDGNCPHYTKRPAPTEKGENHG